MSELTKNYALIEIEALACAAQFLTDTPDRIELAAALMSQIEETAKKALEVSEASGRTDVSGQTRGTA
ncbi:hypothetical protein AO411_2025735 [Salmonella enterica subsp. enterica serovar Sarajane]|nr:hypothetical protein AO411_2025735 [Salmonella enterica subsp. enterica serovar Sarajane]